MARLATVTSYASLPWVLSQRDPAVINLHFPLVT